MTILPEPLEFEWDSGNKEKNEIKHGITSREAEEIFVRKPLLVSDDITHSKHEQRFQAFGRTDQQKLLFVIYTIRKRKIRIISARLMDKKERRIYEEAEKVQKIAGI